MTFTCFNLLFQSHQGNRLEQRYQIHLVQADLFNFGSLSEINSRYFRLIMDHFIFLHLITSNYVRTFSTEENSICETTWNFSLWCYILHVQTNFWYYSDQRMNLIYILGLTVKKGSSLLLRNFNWCPSHTFIWRINILESK